MEGQSKLYNIVIFCQSECTNRFNFCILPLNFAVFWIKDIKVSAVRRISSSILCSVEIQRKELYLTYF